MGTGAPIQGARMTAPADRLRIDEARVDDLGVLRSLGELYAYDFSEMNGAEPIEPAGSITTSGAGAGTGTGLRIFSDSTATSLGSRS